MPTSPVWPTIPVPKEDVISLNASVLALKQVVEMLTGQDNGGREAAHVFVQVDAPEALHKGDFWLSLGASSTLSIWSGDRWVKFANVLASVDGAPDFDLARFQRRR